jgi:hypothetical protein
MAFSTYGVKNPKTCRGAPEVLRMKEQAEGDLRSVHPPSPFSRIDIHILSPIKLMTHENLF